MKQLVSFLLAMVGVSFGLYAQPNILTQPQSTNVHFGATVQFSVSAEYNVLWPHGYQWRFNGSDLADATNSSYTVRFCDATNAGNYSVAVTGRLTFEAPTTVVSSNAVLTVTAATYNSTNTVASSDQQSLLSALTNGGVVLFSCDGTIFLTNSITLTQDTIIDGAGHNIVFDGGGSNRHFNINPNVTVSLRNFTFCNGRAGLPGPLTAMGGSIYNDFGILNVESCIFSNNSCIGRVGPATSQYRFPQPGGAGEGALGGALYSQGVLQISASQFVRNSVLGGHGGPGEIDGQGGAGRGGAILIADGFLHVESSSFTSNTATSGGESQHLNGGGGLGGAIDVASAATASFSESVFTDNSAHSGIVNSFVSSTYHLSGGGALNSEGEVVVNQSTFTSNFVVGNGGQAGGGAVLSKGNLRPFNCNFLQNLANSGDDSPEFFSFYYGNLVLPGYGGDALGGAVLNVGAGLIENCSFSQNKAA